MRTYGKYIALKSITVYGGVNINPQIDALRRGIDILVATPGRLLDHVQQKTVDLRQVEILVLDEARRSGRTCSSPPPSPTRSASSRARS